MLTREKAEKSYSLETQEVTLNEIEIQINRKMLMVFSCSDRKTLLVYEDKKNRWVFIFTSFTETHSTLTKIRQNCG